MGGVLGLAWLCARWAQGWAGLVVGLAAGVILVFSGCCLVSRRLHDLGLAGWWTAAVLLLAALVWLGPISRPGAIGVLVIVALGLCATPGRAHRNRFGPALTP